MHIMNNVLIIGLVNKRKGGAKMAKNLKVKDVLDIIDANYQIDIIDNETNTILISSYVPHAKLKHWVEYKPILNMYIGYMFSENGIFKLSVSNEKYF